MGLVGKSCATVALQKIAPPKRTIKIPNFLIKFMIPLSNIYTANFKTH
jgi:hypothetical protein